MAEHLNIEEQNSLLSKNISSSKNSEGLNERQKTPKSSSPVEAKQQIFVESDQVDRKASYEHLSDNQKQLNYSQSSQQQLKFISTKNLRQTSKKIIEKRGSSRHNVAPAFLKNQTSLNEDLLILETNNGLKNNQSPQTSRLPPKAVPRTTKNKNKSGKQSNEKFEFDKDSPSKSANEFQTSPSIKTRKDNHDSNIYIKDSDFRFQEGGSIGTMNDSNEKFKKGDKILYVKTKQLKNNPNNRKASYDQSSPGTRSPGSSKSQLDRSEMNINTLNQTLHAKNKSEISKDLKMHIKQSLESGSDGQESRNGEKGEETQGRNSTMVQSMISPNFKTNHIPQIAEVRITSKQMNRNEIQNTGVGFLPGGVMPQLGYYLDGTQYFSNPAANFQGFPYQSIRGGQQLLEMSQMQELSSRGAFAQNSIAKYQELRESKKSKRAYDISKNIGVAQKNARKNHKAHQLLGEAARSQQKWMYDFSDDNPMIISSIPTEIPEIRKEKTNNMKIRVSTDGQTQVSLSKFKVDMPGSALKIKDEPMDDQGSHFDPADPRQETFHRQLTNIDDEASPNSPSPRGEQQVQRYDLGNALKMGKEQQMDFTLKNPKLEKIKEKDSNVSTVNDLHQVVSAQMSPSNQQSEKNEMINSGLPKPVDTAASGSRNRVPVTSNLSRNSRISNRKILDDTKSGSNPVTNAKGYQKVNTVPLTQQSQEKLKTVVDSSLSPTTIINESAAAPKTINMEPIQEKQKNFVLNDDNYKTQKLQFESFNETIPQNLKEFSVIGRSNLKSSQDASPKKSSNGRSGAISPNQYNADLTFANPSPFIVKPGSKVSQDEKKKAGDSRMISGQIALQGLQIPMQINEELNMMEEGKKSILGELLGQIENPQQSIAVHSRTNARQSPINNRHSIMSKVSKFEQGTGLDSMMINASKMKFYVSSRGQKYNEVDSSQYQTALSDLNRSRFGQFYSPKDPSNTTVQDKGFGVRMRTYRSMAVDEDSTSQTSVINKPKPAIGSVDAEINPRLGTKAMNRQVLLKKKADLMRKHKGQAGIVNTISDIISQNKKTQKRQERDKTLQTVYLNASHGFWQEKKSGFEDDFDEQKSKHTAENNSLILEDQIQKSNERIRKLPEIHYNESLLGNYKYFGSRKLPELDKILVKEYDSQLMDENAVKNDSLCNSTIQTNFDAGNISILNSQQSDRFDQVSKQHQTSNPSTKEGTRQRDKLTIIGLRKAMKTESANRSQAQQKTQNDIHSAFLKTQFQGIAPSTAKNFNTIRNSKKFDAPLWGPARDIATGNTSKRSNSNWIQYNQEPHLAFRSIQIPTQHNYIQQQVNMPAMAIPIPIQAFSNDLSMVLKQVPETRNIQNNNDSVLSKKNSIHNSIVAESPLGILSPIRAPTINQQINSSQLPQLPQGSARKSIELKNGQNQNSQSRNREVLSKRETLGLQTNSLGASQNVTQNPTSLSPSRSRLIITQDQSQNQKQQAIETEPSSEVKLDTSQIQNKNANAPAKRQLKSTIQNLKTPQYHFQAKEMNVISANSPFYRTFNHASVTPQLPPSQPTLGFQHQNQVFSGCNTILAHNTMYMKHQVRNRKKYGKLAQIQIQKQRRNGSLMPKSNGMESTQEVILLSAEQNSVSCGIDMSPPPFHESEMIAAQETMDIGMSGPISPFHTISPKPEDLVSPIVRSVGGSMRSKGKNSVMSSMDKNKRRGKPTLLNPVKNTMNSNVDKMMTGVYKIQSETKFNEKQVPELQEVESMVFQGASQKHTVYNVIQNGQSKKKYDDYVTQQKQ